MPGPLGDYFGSAVVLGIPKLLALLDFNAIGVMEWVAQLAWLGECRRVLGLRVLTRGPGFAWQAQAQATPRVDVDEVTSSGSLGMQIQGDMQIFLDGLPGGVRVLHITPVCTAAQFRCRVQEDCRLDVQGWSQGLESGCCLGCWYEAGFHGHITCAAAGSVVVPVLDVS